jgi:hypothetical protein
MRRVSILLDPSILSPIPQVLKTGTKAKTVRGVYLYQSVIDIYLGSLRLV